MKINKEKICNEKAEMIYKLSLKKAFKKSSDKELKICIEVAEEILAKRKAKK